MASAAAGRIVQASLWNSSNRTRADFIYQAYLPARQLSMPIVMYLLQ
jgi:hypothetical protein